MQNTLLPFEHEWTCIAFGYNVMKERIEHTKIQKKNNFYQPKKIIWEKDKMYFYIVVLRIYEGDDRGNLFEFLSTLKNKKLDFEKNSFKK